MPSSREGQQRGRRFPRSREAGFVEHRNEGGAAAVAFAERCEFGLEHVALAGGFGGAAGAF